MKMPFALAASMSFAAGVCGAREPGPITVPAQAAKAEVKEPVPELPAVGKNIPRDAGGWLNVEVVGTRLVIKFFDREKKPALPDMERGTVRFQFAAKNSKRAVLNRESDMLVTPATVRPPHNFLVLLTLLTDENRTEVTETYRFKYP